MEVKRILRFIFSVLMLAILFVPLGYIDPSKSVLTKIVDLFKVEYFGMVYFSYVWVIFANFMMCLIGAFTNNYKCMSISRNTSFISSILMFNFALMNNFNLLSGLFIGLGLVVLLFEFINFLVSKDFNVYRFMGLSRKSKNDIVRLVFVLVSFVFIGLKTQDGLDSPMHYHHELLKDYGTLNNGLNLFVCFMFLITIALAIISLIKNYFRLRMHASVFTMVLCFVLFFIPFQHSPEVTPTALVVYLGAVVALINEIYFMVTEKRFDGAER